MSTFGSTVLKLMRQRKWEFTLAILKALYSSSMLPEIGVKSASSNMTIKNLAFTNLVFSRYFIAKKKVVLSLLVLIK